MVKFSRCQHLQYFWLTLTMIDLQWITTMPNAGALYMHKHIHTSYRYLCVHAYTCIEDFNFLQILVRKYKYNFMFSKKENQHKKDKKLQWVFIEPYLCLKEGVIFASKYTYAESDGRTFHQVQYLFQFPTCQVCDWLYSTIMKLLVWAHTL